jgi:hypothetical protein
MNAARNAARIFAVVATAVFTVAAGAAIVVVMTPVYLLKRS